MNKGYKGTVREIHIICLKDEINIEYVLDPLPKIGTVFVNEARCYEDLDTLQHHLLKANRG